MAGIKADERAQQARVVAALVCIVRHAASHTSALRVRRRHVTEDIAEMFAAACRVMRTGVRCTSSAAALDLRRRCALQLRNSKPQRIALELRDPKRQVLERRAADTYRKGDRAQELILRKVLARFDKR